VRIEENLLAVFRHFFGPLNLIAGAQSAKIPMLVLAIAIVH
jgi:hypothetical protein